MSPYTYPCTLRRSSRLITLKSSVFKLNRGELRISHIPLLFCNYLMVHTLTDKMKLQWNFGPKGVNKGYP